MRGFTPSLQIAAVLFMQLRKGKPVRISTLLLENHLKLLKHKPPSLPQNLSPKLEPPAGRSAFITHQKLILEPFQELCSEHFAPKPSKAEEARK